MNTYLINKCTGKATLVSREEAPDLPLLANRIWKKDQGNEDKRNLMFKYFGIDAPVPRLRFAHLCK